jgi:RNA polymerase sigma factor (TIGR02999 family)
MVETTRITSLLQDIDAGRDGATDELMDLVYSDLVNVAQKHMKQRFGSGMDRLTMEPAALVNESFMRLLQQRQGFENRQQFFAIATRVMLRVLVDYCRQRNASKRGGDLTRISISFHDDESTDATPRSTHTGQIELEVLTVALEELEALDARKADVVKLRVIWGMRHEDIAEALGISVPTVECDWRFARAWLADRVAAETGFGGDQNAGA